MRGMVAPARAVARVAVMAAALVAALASAPTWAQARSSHFFSGEDVEILCRSEDPADQEFIMAYMTGLFDAHKRFSAFSDIVGVLRISHFNALWAALSEEQRTDLLEERDGFLENEADLAATARICVPEGTTNEAFTGLMCRWIGENGARPGEAGADLIGRAIRAQASC